MNHKVWIIGNLFFVLGSIIYIWSFRPHDSTLIVGSQFLAQIAIILFFINVNMYFIFLVIRSTSKRNIKVRLAKFSRQLMKWHITIAVTATIIITGHALINLIKLGPAIGYTQTKMLTGYTAYLFLFPVLLAGYFRHRKATGFRKKLHRILAMTFTALFLLHMFVF